MLFEYRRHFSAEGRAIWAGCVSSVINGLDSLIRCFLSLFSYRYSSTRCNSRYSSAVARWGDCGQLSGCLRGPFRFDW
jgi:hypothetical protein